MHPLILTLFTLLPPTLALPRKISPPQLTLTNITYWGSACPADKNSLTTVLGPPSNTTANTTSFPLSFTLANFLPTLDGSFGSSLRMCDIVGTVTVDSADNDDDTARWKVVVNKRGTGVSGEAQVPGNATMYLRGTYSFVESSEKQSVGMLDVRGPLTGPFSQRLVDEDDEGGVVGSCGAPAELSVEFQARAVKDWEEGMIGKRVVNETVTAWVLETDVEVVRC